MHLALFSCVFCFPHHLLRKSAVPNTVKTLPFLACAKAQRERERASELENNHTSSHWELHKLTSSIPSKGFYAAWQYCPALLTSSLIILNINFKPSPLYLELPFHNVSPNFTLGLTFYIFDKQVISKNFKNLFTDHHPYLNLY